MESNSDQNAFEASINELEKAFKTFVSIYDIDLIENKTNHELIKKTALHSNDQTKTNIEEHVSNLYEKAHKLENEFLKYRLEISKSSPEQLIQEEIQLLKAELKRKEDLLNDTKEKLANCEQMLKSFGNNLDYQQKTRLEMTTQGYIPNEPVTFPNVPSNQQPQSVSANQSFEQHSSLDSSVILIK